jgi:hypothetical protein
MEDPWNLSPELEAVKSELDRLGAGDLTGMYLTIIETEADRAKSEQVAPNNDGTNNILSEINNLLRSLKRSRLSAHKVRNKLESLSGQARVFTQVELFRLTGERIDLETIDWSEAKPRATLIGSLEQARNWVRQSSGPNRQENLEEFCRAVQIVYEQIKGKKPGVGRNDNDTYYPSAFECLFVPSMRLMLPNATIAQAREIFRRADWRR